MNELITVVIPIYNVEKYLIRCLESVCNQTYENLQIILVDDGSMDNSGKMCDGYSKKDKRIEVIHKKNGGLSDARNAGIDKAKGKYITFIDSDDEVTLDYVQFLYDTLKKYNAQISACKHYVYYENGRNIDTGSKKEYNLMPDEAMKMMLYSDDMDVSAWAKLYDINLFKRIRYPVGRLFEDAATTYKLFDLSSNIAFKSEAKYIYYIRDDSITTKSFNPKKMDLIISTNEMCDFIEKKYPSMHTASNRRRMYAYLSTLTQLAKVNKKVLNMYDSYKKELMSYIKENREEVLKDKFIPKRDKFALICTKFGFSFFRIMWLFYSYIRK